MEISVNEQIQQFYLATDKKWVPTPGHEIKIGKYRLCAFLEEDDLNLTEVTSGMMFMKIPMTQGIWIQTSTKAGTIQFLKSVAEKLQIIIDGMPDLGERVERKKKESLARLGNMPPIVDVQVDFDEYEQAVYKEGENAIQSPLPRQG